jgi:hypothetical protein
LKKVIKQYDNNSFGDFMFFSLMIQWRIQSAKFNKALNQIKNLISQWPLIL